VSEVKFDNLVVVTVLCHDYLNHEHHFCHEDIAPSQAVHLSLVDVPCVGNFTVSMTVIES
jgi:hypothetical protein